jgi:isopenicillin N synthase-like dioxygenase
MGSSGDLPIPIVDLSPFTSSDANNLESRKKAAQELADKLQGNGYVGIIGHGVPPELLQKAFQTSKTFFDLPYEDKMKAPHPDGTVPHRGYSAIGREKGYAKTAHDSGDDAQQDAELSLIDYKVGASPPLHFYLLDLTLLLGELRDWK